MKAQRSNPMRASLLACLLLVVACTTPERRTTRLENERLNRELLEQLIDQRALAPADDQFGDEDYFAELEREYAAQRRAEGLLPGRKDETEEEAPPAEDQQPGEGADATTGDPAVDPGAGAIVPTEPGQEPQVTDVQQAPPFNPYLEFGKNIIPHDDDGDGRWDRVTKPVALPLEMGARVQRLFTTYSTIVVLPKPVRGETQVPGTLHLDLRAGAMIENWTNPRSPQLEASAIKKLGDILYVTGYPPDVLEFERFLDTFFGSPRQIEIEARIVEVTTSDALDLGISPVLSDGEALPIFGLPDHTFVSGVTYDFGNSVSSGEALFTFSSIHDGLVFNAVLEAAASYENVSIISRPKVAVREGARAEIINTQQVPFYNIQGLNYGGGYTASLTYKDAGIKLYVIPHLVGENTIDLTIDIEASQVSGTSVSFVGQAGGSISNPVITNRSAKTTVYLQPGQAVILGGLVSERIVEEERKIPLLGDFPLIGGLFRSTYKRREMTNVLFFIRPRILQGSDLNRPFE